MKAFKEASKNKSMMCRGTALPILCVSQDVTKALAPAENGEIIFGQTLS
jgi:hypothetical protein